MGLSKKDNQSDIIFLFKGGLWFTGGLPCDAISFSLIDCWKPELAEVNISKLSNENLVIANYHEISNSRHFLKVILFNN